MKKILVVDDEKNVAEFLKTLLEDTGKYVVRMEYSGKAAFQTALKFRPDLILLDVMMKDMGGDALADKVRSEPAIRDTPIVFLTGIVTQEEVKANGGRIGGYPYMAKPIMVMSDLTNCVEANIRKNT